MRSLFFCASIAPNGIENGTEYLDFFFQEMMQIFNSWAITAIFFSLSPKNPKRMDFLFMEVFGVFCFFLFYVNLKHRLLSGISVMSRDILQF